ncbi:MAG: SGNH/GDSL hydrolase family protein [Clostridia bacterium]|nr:SGNH/GDSL hydrolase family protein [Clostridia bacterium]
MKKLLYIFLTLVIIFSLVGCNSEKGILNEEIESNINETETEVVPEPEPIPDPRIPDTSKAYIYENNPKLTPVDYDSPALLCLSEDMGQEYIDKMVFICDSPTYWMKPYELLSGGKETTQIWTGPTGTQTFPYYKGFKLLDPYDNTEKLVVTMAKEHQPEIMVLALGINGIAKRSEDSFTSIYKNLVEDLMDASPDSTVVCMSIYPISPKYKRWDIINNEVITRGNSWIMNVCNQTGAYYLDAAAALLGEDGNVILELSKNDGFHPNKDGLEKVLEYIRTHAFYAERPEAAE